MSGTYEIRALLTGRVRPFRGPDEPSAIAKSALDGPAMIGPLGLAGDEQADLRVHGGPDKAIHHYPADHYPFWREELGDHSLLGQPGAFGENVSTLGLAEDAVCLGDRFRLGTALVEVSQGRQPCWKQGHRLDDPRVTATIVETGRTGWYYRVIEPGKAAAGDMLEHLDRPLPGWPVSRAFRLLIAGFHKTDPEGLRELAVMPVLASPWRHRAAQLLTD